MASAFDELRKILIPPDDPISPGTAAEWDALEDRLGTRLPDDYKAFVRTYGHGTPDDYLSVLNPFVTPYNLESEMERHRINYRETYSRSDYHLLREGLDSDVPDGLIPWASGDGGNGFWDTRSGEPNGWTVLEENYNYWQAFPGTMSELLVQALTGKFRSIVTGMTPRRLPIHYWQYRNQSL